MAMTVTSEGGPDWSERGWNEQLGLAISDDLPDLPGKPPEGTDRELLASLNRIYEYEVQVRKPREANWARAWDRFYNRWDFSRKKPWQSKRGLPVITQLALKFAWEMIKPLEMAGGDWFEVSTRYEPYRSVLQVPKILLRKYLSLDGNYDESEFMTAYYDSIVGACLSDMLHMMVMPENEGMADWQPEAEPFSEESMAEEEPGLDDLELPDISLSGPASPEDGLPTIEEMTREFRLRYEPINPRNVLLDTTTRGQCRYKMYVQPLTTWQFLEMAEKFGWENAEEIVAAASQSDSGNKTDTMGAKSREKAEGGSQTKYDYINMVHFMGSLMDEKGRHLFKDQYCSFVGEHICQKPVDLGLWHGQIPIISAPMIRVPWSTYHMSMVQLNLDPQEARVEMLNGLLDYLHQIINPVTEIDHDLLDPSYGVAQIRAGLAPGQVVHARKGGRPNAPVVARSQTPDLGSGTWQGLGWFKQEWSEGSGLSDTGAMPRSRNRISAQEFKERQIASGGVFQQISRTLERRFLVPMLRQSYLTILQKCPQEVWDSAVDEALEIMGATQDSEDPSKAENSREAQYLRSLKGMKPKMRYKKMGGPFRFEVKVYSAIESRRELVEQVSAINEMAAANPAFAQRIRWHKTAEMGMIGLQADPAEMLWPDTGATQEQPMVGKMGENIAGAPPMTPPRAPGQENL